MIIESGPDFHYSQLGSLLGGHSVKKRYEHSVQAIDMHNVRQLCGCTMSIGPYFISTYLIHITYTLIVMEQVPEI